MQISEVSRPILVTGATGSIGLRLAERLHQAGQLVRALVRDPAKAQRLGELGITQIVQADLGKPESLRGCMSGCSIVFHCAAKLLGSDRASFEAVNVEGTKALLREAEKEGVERFVHASTIGVYACSEAENIEEDFPWPESHNPYFETKQNAEQVVWERADRVRFTIARLGDVFGPGQYVWTVNPIRQIQRGILHPPTDGDSGLFNPVYIENAIDALILLGTHPAALGQAFNVVDGRPMPFSDYYRSLARIARKKTRAVPSFVLKLGATVLMDVDLLMGREASAKPEDVDYLLHKGTISGKKIGSLLGWRPAVSYEEAFRRTEEWLRAEQLIPSV